MHSPLSCARVRYTAIQTNPTVVAVQSIIWGLHTSMRSSYDTSTRYHTVQIGLRGNCRTGTRPVHTDSSTSTTGKSTARRRVRDRCRTGTSRGTSLTFTNPVKLTTGKSTSLVHIYSIKFTTGKYTAGWVRGNCRTGTSLAHTSSVKFTTGKSTAARVRMRGAGKLSDG